MQTSEWHYIMPIMRAHARRQLLLYKWAGSKSVMSALENGRVFRLLFQSASHARIARRRSAREKVGKTVQQYRRTHANR
jgi:hypothetical protein